MGKHESEIIDKAVAKLVEHHPQHSPEEHRQIYDELMKHPHLNRDLVKQVHDWRSILLSYLLVTTSKFTRCSS